MKLEPEYSGEPPIIPPIPRKGVVEANGKVHANTISTRQVTYNEQVVDDNQNTPFEIALYQTNELTNANGRIPEQVVANQLVRTFNRNNRDLRVIYGLNVVNGIDSQEVTSTCTDGVDGIDLFRAYMEQDPPVVAADSNILMMNTGSGGCAGIGGNVGVAPGGDVFEDRGLVASGIDDWTGNVNAVLHEIGHNMGFTHCGTDDWPPHAGRADIIGDEWVKTPTTACNGLNNACGEWIQERPAGLTDRYVLDYHDCVWEQMIIEPKPLIGEESFLTARFTWTPQIPAVNQEVLFDGTLSIPGDDATTVVDYFWTFPDEVIRGTRARYTFTEVGEYDVSLTVENDIGEVDITTRTLQVESDPPPVFAGGAALFVVAAGFGLSELRRRRES